MDIEHYDRITAVLAPFSGIEFIPEHILTPACERGTRVHKEIEADLNGLPSFVLPEHIKPYMESYRLFWSKFGHSFKGDFTIEKRLYCKDKQITGQIDLVIETDDRTYLIDWKTSSAKHATWDLQGAAYRYLCEQDGMKNLDNMTFVKLDKKGRSPVLSKSEAYEENLDMFFKCLEIYRFFDMKKTRNNWSKKDESANY